MYTYRAQTNSPFGGRKTPHTVPVSGTLPRSSYILFHLILKNKKRQLHQWCQKTFSLNAKRKALFSTALIFFPFFYSFPFLRLCPSAFLHFPLPDPLVLVADVHPSFPASLSAALGRPEAPVTGFQLPVASAVKTVVDCWRTATQHLAKCAVYLETGLYSF